MMDDENNLSKIQNKDKKFKEKVIKALKEKNVTLLCPRCSNKSWSIEGFFSQPLQSVQMQNIIIGGPSIPSVVVICRKCGYISQHALGTLGLLPKQHHPSGNGE